MQNNAVNLLEKMGIVLNKTATFEINGVEIGFEFDNAIYDNFINEVAAGNKITAMKDFLQISVIPADREKLNAILDIPTMPIELMNAVQSHFVPKINISLKNSNSV